MPVRRLSRTLLAASAVLPLALAGLVALPGTSTAAPAAATADLWAPPSPLPAGAPGQLIRSRAVALDLGPTAPATRAWTVMYHSRDSLGHDVPVTGTVLRPDAAWAGSGPRPVVSFAVGTQGMGPQCAPSRQLRGGTEYEASEIAAALQQGWAVAVTDDEGYTTGDVPTYVAGRSEGHAVLDVVRAAQQVEGSSVRPRSPLALWGYSQGGGASAWATVLHPAYAPELRLVGDASGGVPADAKAVGDSLDGNVGAAFLLYSSVGFAAEYGRQFPIYGALNAAGRQAFADVKTQCVTDSLPAYAFRQVDDYLKAGVTLQGFEARPAVAKVLRDNTLTVQSRLPRVPVYQYHGLADEVVPLAQARALHAAWCAKGVDTRMDLFPGEHLTTNAVATASVLAFLSDRFAGRPLIGSCLT